MINLLVRNKNIKLTIYSMESASDVTSKTDLYNIIDQVHVDIKSISNRINEIKHKPKTKQPAEYCIEIYKQIFDKKNERNTNYTTQDSIFKSFDLDNDYYMYTCLTNNINALSSLITNKYGKKDQMLHYIYMILNLLVTIDMNLAKCPLSSEQDFLFKLRNNTVHLLANGDHKQLLYDHILDGINLPAKKILIHPYVAILHNINLIDTLDKNHEIYAQGYNIFIKSIIMLYVINIEITHLDQQTNYSNILNSDLDKYTEKQPFMENQNDLSVITSINHNDHDCNNEMCDEKYEMCDEKLNIPDHSENNDCEEDLLNDPIPHFNDNSLFFSNDDSFVTSLCKNNKLHNENHNQLQVIEEASNENTLRSLGSQSHYLSNNKNSQRENPTKNQSKMNSKNRSRQNNNIIDKQHFTFNYEPNVNCKNADDDFAYKTKQHSHKPIIESDVSSPEPMLYNIQMTPNYNPFSEQKTQTPMKNKKANIHILDSHCDFNPLCENTMDDHELSINNDIHCYNKTMKTPTIQQVNCNNDQDNNKKITRRNLNGNLLYMDNTVTSEIIYDKKYSTPMNKYKSQAKVRYNTPTISSRYDNYSSKNMDNNTMQKEKNNTTIDLRRKNRMFIKKDYQVVEDHSYNYKHHRSQEKRYNRNNHFLLTKDDTLDTSKYEIPSEHNNPMECHKSKIKQIEKTVSPKRKFMPDSKPIAYNYISNQSKIKWKNNKHIHLSNHKVTGSKHKIIGLKASLRNSIEINRKKYKRLKSQIKKNSSTANDN